MSKQSTASKGDNLAKEVENLPTKGGKSLSDEVTELLSRLATENDTMQEEMHALKKQFGHTMKMGRDESKAEIAHHPVQSVIMAFALGAVACLLVRR